MMAVITSRLVRLLVGKDSRKAVKFVNVPRWLPILIKRTIAAGRIA